MNILRETSGYIAEKSVTCPQSSQIKGFCGLSSSRVRLFVLGSLSWQLSPVIAAPRHTVYQELKAISITIWKLYITLNY